MTKADVHDALCVLHRPDTPDDPGERLLRLVLEHDAVLRDYRTGEIIPCPSTPRAPLRYCAAVEASLALRGLDGPDDHGTIMFEGRLVYAA